MSYFLLFFSYYFSHYYNLSFYQHTWSKHQLLNFFNASSFSLSDFNCYKNELIEIYYLNIAKWIHEQIYHSWFKDMTYEKKFTSCSSSTNLFWSQFDFSHAWFSFFKSFNSLEESTFSESLKKENVNIRIHVKQIKQWTQSQTLFVKMTTNEITIIHFHWQKNPNLSFPTVNFRNKTL